MYTVYLINLSTPRAGYCVIDHVSGKGSVRFLPFDDQQIVLIPGHTPWKEWIQSHKVYYTFSVSTLADIVPTIISNYPEALI